MNIIIILNILGWIIGAEGLLLLLPAGCAALYREPVGFAFLLTGGACVIAGLLCCSNL